MCGKARLLVVDDDSMMRDFSERVLTSLGFSCVTAADAESALLLLEADRSIQVLFTDMGLGKGMDGAQLAQLALGLRPDLGVILTSGLPDSLPVPGGDLPRNIQILPKPYRRNDLAARLSALL